MRMQKMTGAFLAAVLGAAALASCGSGAHEPEPLEKQSDSENKDTASTTTDTESDSPFPNKDVTEAAQAWLDASNKAMKTLDPEPMLALSAPNCENCDHFASYLRDLKKNGGHLEGKYAEVPRNVQAPSVDGKTATVTMTVEHGRYSEISKTGASPTTFEPDTYDIEFHLKRENGSWIVTEMVPMVEE